MNLAESTPPRYRADAAFWILSALGGVLLTAFLAALAGWGVAPWAVYERCLAFLERAHPAWEVTVGSLLLFGIGDLALGIGTLCQQAASTHALVRGLRRRVLAGTPSSLQHLLSAHGLRGRVDVVGDTAVYAFSVGFWRPRIMLSLGLLDLLAPDELTAILLHEAHHMRVRDSSKVAVVRAVARALFFLPVAQDLAWSYRVLKELAADQYAIRHMGDRWPLASALWKLTRAGPGNTRAAAVAGGTGEMTLRIRQVLEYPGVPRLPFVRSGSRAVVSAITMAMVTGLSIALTDPASASAHLFVCPVSTHRASIGLRRNPAGLRVGAVR